MVMFGLSVVMSATIKLVYRARGGEATGQTCRRRVRIYEGCTAGAARGDIGVLNPGLLNVGKEAP
ncbi:hypothetical protein PISMIDRAFT_680975 [Pisolithus microcarpus 441]|uniref:Uncharacterized protein n=1 Tax=Pisolithus microcarpus 441 TaxID=765257 RepID=A0A0C9ZH66_9AGAM|nr:hypothetical protein PISMIDRAFT_680975 [Pisolithus microcarpus 441]